MYGACKPVHGTFKIDTIAYLNFKVDIYISDLECLHLVWLRLLLIGHLLNIVKLCVFHTNIVSRLKNRNTG